jgi:hypothetical protein
MLSYSGLEEKRTFLFSDLRLVVTAQDFEDVIPIV